MTKEGKLAIEASRELDTKVAESIFGFKVELRDGYYDPECSGFNETQSNPFMIPIEGETFVKELCILVDSHPLADEVKAEYMGAVASGVAGWVSDKFEDWRELPHYSTDIAAAWKIVEKMEELSWRLRLTARAETNSQHWAACFVEYIKTKSKQERKNVCAFCRRETEAICNAALLTLGAK